MKRFKTFNPTKPPAVANGTVIIIINGNTKLFKKIDDLDLLNKRAVFIYMRDLSNLNPKQLSVAMSIIRKHYKGLIKTGDFDIF